MSLFSNFWRKRFYRRLIGAAQKQVWDLELKRQILTRALQLMQEDADNQQKRIEEKRKGKKIDMDEIKNMIAVKVQIENAISGGNDQTNRLSEEIIAKNQRMHIMKEHLKEI